MDDFKELISVAHKLNLKVMIDVVFNHTSHDSVLMKEHPGSFYFEFLRISQNGTSVMKKEMLRKK